MVFRITYLCIMLLVNLIIAIRFVPLIPAPNPDGLADIVFMAPWFLMFLMLIVVALYADKYYALIILALTVFYILAMLSPEHLPTKLSFTALVSSIILLALLIRESIRYSSQSSRLR